MPLIQPSRRGFLIGLGASFIAYAPALVRAEALMPIKALPLRPSLLSYTLYRRRPDAALEKYVVETLLPLTAEQLNAWQFAEGTHGWSIVVMPDELTPPLACPLIKGEPHAPQIGQVQRDILAQRPRRDQSRQAAEAGRRHRLRQEA